MMRISSCIAAVLAACFAFAATAHSEPVTVRIAKQPGVAYLPLMVMEQERLFEKRAKDAGVEIKTEWLRFTGGSVMNEALIAGDLDIASGGTPPLLTIWAKTANNLKVKGLASLSAAPQFLLTTNPKVKTIRDFSAADKIAVPAVKVSNQAVMLQMAAAKELGEDKALSLDQYTVSMGHPDAIAAMLGGGSVNSHFSQSPFQDIALRDPRVHVVLDSWDVVGGPYPIATTWATTRFSEKNPKLLEAFVAAVKDAQAIITSDPDRAADLWIKADVTKFSHEEALSILKNPKIIWDAAPQNTITFARHMYKVGLLNRAEEDWRSIYFPYIHDLKGS